MAVPRTQIMAPSTSILGTYKRQSADNHPVTGHPKLRFCLNLQKVKFISRPHGLSFERGDYFKYGETQTLASKPSLMIAGRIPQVPHHCNPYESVAPDHLADFGVLHWKLNLDKNEDDKVLENSTTTRGYNYMVL
ncbi:hypothetical protein LXL04_023189 [Taraxacum kok-saghyz]